MMHVPETDIRRVFQVSLWLKAAHSLLEVLGGLALVFLSHDLVLRMVTAVTAAELLEEAVSRKPGLRRGRARHCQIKPVCYAK